MEYIFICVVGALFIIISLILSCVIKNNGLSGDILGNDPPMAIYNPKRLEYINSSSQLIMKKLSKEFNDWLAKLVFKIFGAIGALMIITGLAMILINK